MIKKIISLVLLLFLVCYTGCSDNPTDGGTLGGIGGGNTGGGSTVTFTIMSQDGQNGGKEILAKPNVDVTLTSVNVKVPEVDFDETYEGDGTTVFSKNEWALINEYTGVTSGMKFVIHFVGKTSPDNKAFDVTSNYTIP